ncbi:MAG: hydantoinase B/oxoprolinase family protein [Solirubrobacteraceae bacterium]
MASTATTISPIVLEIIEGTVRSAELEIEAAVERTSRSPMIRDQHDYRVALFDARGRKLTGRSYSALIEPVLARWPIEDMRPGDVFFYNDPYRSEGGIGHVPDLCTTVPIFHQERLIGFAQVFGHHDDVGGMVPGSLPVHATSIFQEGLLVPPIKLYDAGTPNEAAFAIIARNSRLPDHLRGDVDAEIGACLVGSRRIAELAERYGVDTLEAAFQAILDKCAATIRAELLPKIADGVYRWEDYIEADGVDEPRLHAIRLTMTKTPEKIVLDFNGTDPQAKGPINWAVSYCDGRFLRKWLAPILRNLADTPERAAEIDMNEGVLDVIEAVFPPPGSLITPEFPAPVGMRFFVMLRSLGVFAGCLAKATGGRVPADQESIRIWGLHGDDDRGRFFLFREVLGGGSGGRWYADGSDVVHIVPNSRNLPVEFSEARYPVVVESLALRTDSGGAGEMRGGLGYHKRIRVLQDVELLSNADRSALRPYGLRGGRAGGRYGVAVERPDQPREDLPGLADDVPVPTGSVVEIVTTGGGGWGDPLARDPEAVRLDVVRGLVSDASARDDYGVVLRDDRLRSVDAGATESLRQRLADERGKDVDMFDRGDHYADLIASGQAPRRPDGWSDPDVIA